MSQKLALYACLKDKIHFRQFFFKTHEGKPWQSWFYQFAPAMSDEFAMYCGRGCGKTDELIKDTLQDALLLPGQETLIATQFEIHLTRPCDSLIDIINTHSFFKLFKGPSHRRPFYKFFLGKHIIHGLSAGSEGGSNFLGLHVDRIKIDEAQKVEKVVEQKMRQAVRNDACKWKYYGVLDGRRDTCLYQHAFNDPSIRDKTFRFPSYLRPTWTYDEGTRLEREYGGRGSQTWLNNVEGEAGEPTYGVWPYKDMVDAMISTDPLIDVVVTMEDLKDHQTIDFDFARENRLCWFSLDFLSLPIFDFKYDECYGGLDASSGFGDPAVLILAFKIGNKWKIPVRYSFSGISPNDVTWMVKYIMQAYNCSIIAIDTTGADGKNVRDNLASYTTYPVTYSENVIVGEGPDGNPTEANVKEFSTKLAVDNLRSNRFIICDSPSWLMEFEQEKVKRGVSGRLIYNAPTDHTISSFRALNLLLWDLPNVLNPHEQEEGQTFEVIGTWKARDRYA